MAANSAIPLHAHGIPSFQALQRDNWIEKYCGKFNTGPRLRLTEITAQLSLPSLNFRLLFLKVGSRCGCRLQQARGGSSHSRSHFSEPGISLRKPGANFAVHTWGKLVSPTPRW